MIVGEEPKKRGRGDLQRGRRKIWKRKIWGKAGSDGKSAGDGDQEEEEDGRSPIAGMSPSFSRHLDGQRIASKRTN